MTKPTIGGLPRVKRINSFELSDAELEEKRVELKIQDSMQRNEFFGSQMMELAYSRLCMDRVFMRNAIRQIQLCVEEHQHTLQLTDEEKAEWQRLASAALLDRKAEHVPQHCQELLNFWQMYRTGQGK